MNIKMFYESLLKNKIFALFFSFKGSIGRKNYSSLFFVTTFFICVPEFIMNQENIVILFVKFTILLSVSISYLSILVRRLHDLGYYGIDMLLALAIPIYNFYVYFSLFFRSGLNAKSNVK